MPRRVGVLLRFVLEDDPVRRRGPPASGLSRGPRLTAIVRAAAPARSQETLRELVRGVCQTLSVKTVEPAKKMTVSRKQFGLSDLER